MPSDKKEKKRKKDRSDRDESRRDRDHGDRKDKSKSSALAPSEAGILALLGRCCFDVSPCCVKVDRIDTLGDDRRSHKKDKERKERRERKQRKDDAERGQENFSAKPRQSSPPRSPGRGGSEDNGSERSCTSRAESDYSRQTTARSTRGGGGGESSRGLRRERSAGNESARSCKSEGRGRRQSEARSAETPSAGPSVDGKVKVMSLADLRGQELPADIVQAGAAKLGGAAGVVAGCRVAEDDEVRSEGGRSSRSNRSARSTRSAAQSEGGASVKSAASVSVRKYMGYLSEPKSAAEVKKLVKDFVRQMVKGRDLGVLCADGALKPVICSISRSLDTFKIKSGDQTRRVPLKHVESVLHGNPDELNDLQTPLDEACSTMEIENGECISFKFAERKAAELFTLCMQLFVDGQRPQT